MQPHVYQLMETFPVLTSGMDIDPVPYTGGMEFYEGLSSRFDSFENHVLVSCHEFNEAWPTWESHPKGDELVVLLSGSATLVVQVDGERHSADLSSPGQYVVIPRGAWHTASAASNARMLFITPGEGTENRVEP